MYQEVLNMATKKKTTAAAAAKIKKSEAKPVETKKTATETAVVETKAAPAAAAAAVQTAEKPADTAVVKTSEKEDVKAAAPAKKSAASAAKATKSTAAAASKTKSTAAAKTTVKKAAAKKAEPKKEEAKAEPAKKAPAKKAAAKKAEPKAEVKKEEPKAEPKAEVKAEATKAETKAEIKVEAKKAEAKAEVKKEEPKAEAKVEAKAAPAKKAPAKKAAAKKAPAKKAAPKKAEAPKISDEEKKASYNAFELNTCIDMAKAMGIDMNYDDYAKLLMVIADPKEIEAEILKKYPVDASKLNYEEDGYDLSLLPVLIERIGDGMEVKASSFKSLADKITAALAMELSDDGTANADVYNTLFDLVRQVLMLGQNRNYHTLKEMDAFIPADLEALVVKFMDTAYAVLPTWQYKDVKYYKDFLYAVLNQFEDLHAPYDNRAMMDVADLLIKHGDYGLGDAEYNYVLRENDLKDQIYFRFANVYRDLDLNKAKAIANDALRIVDNRYDYYPKIIEILES